MAFYAFVRNFATTFGITIAGTILQNGLQNRLPVEFNAQLQAQPGAEIAYAAIPLIPSLPEPLRTHVREAFASSISDIWKTMIGFAGAGLISVFLMKEVAMHTVTDERFVIESKDSEKKSSPSTALDPADPIQAV
jgi:hypothetical protein